MTDVVLVSGAAGAIGAATVTRFLHAGWRVAGIDRDGSVLENKASGFRPCCLDLADEAALAEGIAQLAQWGPLRHVIAIAGGALPQEPKTLDPAALDVSVFRESLEANLVTQFSFLRAALPWLRRSGGDRSITLTSSFNALTGCGMPAYSAAKAGAIGMMHALAPVLGAEGIRINVVAPGTVRTPRTERIWAHDPDHWTKLQAGTVLGKLGTPDDVANVFFAAATIMTHVTGQVIVVDGGQMVKRP